MSRSKLKTHAAILRQLDGSNVDVGWFENARYPTGQSVAAVMIANEFGTSKMPARPLLRQTAAILDKKVPDYIERRTLEMMEGKLSPEKYQKQLGEAMVATMLDTLKAGDFEGNADSTIAQKGFDKPLVRDGILGQSITHRTS